jgi:hypothetical protein
LISRKIPEKNVHIADAIIRPVAKAAIVDARPGIEELTAHISLAEFARFPIAVLAESVAIGAVISEIFDGQVVINAGKVFFYPILITEKLGLAQLTFRLQVQLLTSRKDHCPKHRI